MGLLIVNEVDMAKIIIRDLDMSKELDQKAMKELVGGSRTGAGKQSGAWKQSKQASLFHAQKPKRLI